MGPADARLLHGRTVRCERITGARSHRTLTYVSAAARHVRGDRYRPEHVVAYAVQSGIAGRPGTATDDSVLPCRRLIARARHGVAARREHLVGPRRVPRGRRADRFDPPGGPAREGRRLLT